jgi:hypothetical protein
VICFANHAGERPAEGAGRCVSLLSFHEHRNSTINHKMKEIFCIRSDG